MQWLTQGGKKLWLWKHLKEKAQENYLSTFGSLTIIWNNF
jgi:hypothetical protein